MNFHHYDNPLVPAPVRLCPACDMPTRRHQLAVEGHSAITVWSVLDEDQCPACGSFLPRSGLRLALKNRIARRLLGFAPTVHGPYQGLPSGWRWKDVR